MAAAISTVLITTSTISANVNALRASEEIPPVAQSRPIVLTGATVHTVSGETIENGQVLMEGGLIRSVGRALALPARTEVVNVSGKHIYPGLVSANTVLGLVEIGAVRATIDTGEPGAINPNVRAEVSINPDSELFPVARANGVLTALSVPQAGNSGLVAGTSALIKLDGWTWEDMTLKSRVGLHLFWPTLTINRDPNFPKSAQDQQTDIDRRLRQLRDTFAVARAYSIARKTNGTAQAIDARWESMLPVFEGKLPVFIHAEAANQIKSALDWSESEKLSMVLVGGQDAWRLAGLLKARDIPVIIGSVMTLPVRRGDSYDSTFANASKLFKAGVRFAIANDGTTFEAHNDRNLPYQAAMAAAHGLPKLEALKAVTLYPAQILGVAGRLGSLESGKDATLIVTTGDPLEISTRVEMAFIQGRPISLANRQTRLYDKYRQKYEQLKTAAPISASGQN